MLEQYIERLRPYVLELFEKVRDILANVDLTAKQVDAICFAIENHEEYNWNGNNVEDLNTLILQDADNLEAIGAIGVGRAFCYGGAHNLAMYTPEIPLDESDDYKESIGDNESTLHHFYHKLFKLENNMNTKTGKTLAKDRTDFMREFAKRFFEEWDMKDE